MNQKDLWDSKWKKVNRLLPANNYARKCYKTIENKNFKTLLHLGCGYGKDSIYFANKGFHVTSIDFSENAISIFRKTISKKELKNITPLTEDIRKMHFEKNSFDVIYANLSLHYFNDKETSIIFEKLHKYLKSNGYLFVRCKSTKDSIAQKGEEVEPNIYLHNNKISHLFSKKYLKTLMSKFEIIKLRNHSSKQITIDDTTIKSYFIECIAKKQ